MNKLLLVPAAILPILLVAGCSGGLGGSGAKDCGTDLSCFSQLAASCTPVKVTVDTSTLPGASSSSPAIVMLSEVQGGTTSACKVYYKIEDVKFPAGTPEQYKHSGSIIKGLDMTCTLPVSGMSALPGSGMSANPLSSSDMAQKCTGKLIDLFT